MFIRRRSSLRLLLLVALSPCLLGSLGPRTNFNERILAAQNRERNALSIPPLEWDDQLARGAADWAEHLSRTGHFEHSPDPNGTEPLGENIWGGTPGYYQPESMVALWIAEKKYYKHGVFPANSRTGKIEDVSHYTQLIWRRTKRVGCAISSSGPEEILVCRYSSAGNVIGQNAV